MLLNQIRDIDAILRRLSSERREFIDAKRLHKSGRKTQALLTYLRNTPLIDERGAGSAVGEEEGSQAFHALKSSIYSKLVNSAFLLDPKRHGYSAYGVSYYRNQRLVFACKTMAFFGARKVADTVALRGLKVAQRLELASNAVEFLTVLQHGAVLRSDLKLLRRYSKLSEHWLNVLIADQAVTGLHNEVIILHTKRGSTNRSVTEKTSLAANHARELYQRHRTFNLGLAYYRLEALSLQCKGHYDSCLEICTEAETFVLSRPDFSNATRLAEFAMKRLACSIELRSAAKGEEAINVCLKAYPEGSINWFALMENRFLLYSITLSLDLAKETVESVMAAQGFYDLPEFRRERWSVYKLYLLYVDGSLQSSTRLKSKGSSSPKDFLRLIPSYSQDKAGFNAAILILHILHLLSTREFKLVFDRIDALKSYRGRHLRVKNSQVDVFIQLLIKVDEFGYSRHRVKQATRTLSQKLEATELLSDSQSGIQILPFNWLWGRVLECLNP